MPCRALAPTNPGGEGGVAAAVAKAEAGEAPDKAASMGGRGRDYAIFDFNLPPVCPDLLEASLFVPRLFAGDLLQVGGSVGPVGQPAMVCVSQRTAAGGCCCGYLD